MKKLILSAALALAMCGLSAANASAKTFGLFTCGGCCGCCCSSKCCTKVCLKQLNAFTPLSCAADGYVCGKCCGGGLPFCWPPANNLVPPMFGPCCGMGYGMGGQGGPQMGGACCGPSCGAPGGSCGDFGCGDPGCGLGQLPPVGALPPAITTPATPSTPSAGSGAAPQPLPNPLPSSPSAGTGPRPLPYGPVQASYNTGYYAQPGYYPQAGYAPQAPTYPQAGYNYGYGYGYAPVMPTAYPPANVPSYWYGN